MRKPSINLLFTAPMDFDSAIMDGYERAFDVLWMVDIFPTENTLSFTNYEKYRVWVCNPKANRVIDESVLRFFPNLEILATPSTGLNHIDLDACAKRGVKVISLLDDRAGLDDISASSEFTFKLLLDALRKPPARELKGKTIGLIGFGRIGKQVEGWVKQFGAGYTKVYDPPRLPFRNRADQHTVLGNIFQTCDAVVICCTYNAETHHMIGADLLRSMKHGAALVNTSRGEVIDEYALAMVMEERPDLRVAVDVLEGEVTGTANPQRLISRGAIVTPHIAGETFDSRTKAARIILNLLKKEL
jgi:D-3-phosphoglycerate dehydrogenase